MKAAGFPISIINTYNFVRLDYNDDEPRNIVMKFTSVFACEIGKTGDICVNDVYFVTVSAVGLLFTAAGSPSYFFRQENPPLSFKIVARIHSKWLV